MIKKVFGRKLGRGRTAREALFASLTRAMILNGKMVTTKAKAKAVQRDVEKIVTMAKLGTLSARRRALGILDNANDATDKLFDQVVGSFKTRNSGYTRIVNLTPRKGDNTSMVRMEWTEVISEAKKEEKKEKSAKVEKKATKTVKKTKVAKK
ncbi:MAG: 50S ribosomal protein L17 [Microgenomates group bacterium]